MVPAPFFIADSPQQILKARPVFITARFNRICKLLLDGKIALCCKFLEFETLDIDACIVSILAGA